MNRDPAAREDAGQPPEIRLADRNFVFRCGSDLPCFNQCCRDLDLPLTPYDVMRLAWVLDMTQAEFLQKFALLTEDSVTGLAQARMRMQDGCLGPCPFVRPEGFAVYPHRPGACRAYPVGRGASLVRAGRAIRYYMIEQKFCCGFGHGGAWTPEEWLGAQGLGEYNVSNDQLLRLICMIRASGAPLDERLKALARMALFDQEKFRRILLAGGLLARLDLPLERIGLLRRDTLQGREAALALAMDWLELMIFGEAQGLKLKKNS